MVTKCNTCTKQEFIDRVNNVYHRDTIVKKDSFVKISYIPREYVFHHRDTIQNFIHDTLFKNTDVKSYINSYQDTNYVLNDTIFAKQLVYHGWSIDVCTKEKLITKYINTEKKITEYKNYIRLGVGLSQDLYPYSINPSVFLMTRDGTIISASKSLNTSNFNITISKSLIKF